jgi:NADH:ubiquinone oxidoreductase subunit E/NAD-dependent dihydropyrimidine dehydrogenase PreA subunit
MKKLGVFVCHCGINIASTVDIPEVMNKLDGYTGVVSIKDYKYMCSDPGQKMIAETIEKEKLDGVVVGCCTPTLHEKTFRKVSVKSGLNEYMCEIANIREQCSWVTNDKKEATQKAGTLLRSVIEKIKQNESLEQIEIPVTRTALVVGAGIAGMQSAIDIADNGYKVIMVEKNPSIGGRMSQLSETFPTLDCSQCIMTPKMVEASQHPNIRVMTNSVVDDVSGFVGNFNVKIRKKARFVDEIDCTGCGECSTACPIQNEPQVNPMPDYSLTIDAKELEKLNKIFEPYKGVEGSLIQALQKINEEYNYLPEFAMEYAALTFQTPLSEIYHIATFYDAFSLEPRGEHVIKVCMGTACHARNAPNILDELQRQLGIGVNKTTKDGKFTLTTVNCLGCCALGPVVVIDDDYHTVKLSDIKNVLGKYK